MAAFRRFRGHGPRFARSAAPEPQACFDGGKKRRGSKVHIAAETLGSLLALVVTPANVQDREVAARLAVEVQ